MLSQLDKNRSATNPVEGMLEFKACPRFVTPVS